MKKNIKLNKQIIKALSIGISASMMLQPMSAFAAEDGENNNNGDSSNITNIDENSTVAVADVDQEVKTVTEPMVDGAIEKVEETVKLADELKVPTENIKKELYTSETEKKEESASTEQDAPSTEENAAPAEGSEESETPAAPAEGSEEAQTPAVLESDAEKLVDEIKSDVLTITTEDANIATEVGLADKANSAASTAAGEADKVQKAIEEEIEAAAGQVETADKKVDEEIADIKAATTEEGARESYNQAETVVKEADAAVNKAAEDLTQAETDFAKAESDYETAKTAYNEAVGRLNTAKQAYETAQGEADTDAKAAAEELGRLAQEAENLRLAALDAETNYNKTGMGYIAALEKALQGTKVNFTNKDESDDKCLRSLFEAIVKFYYIPTTTEEGTVTDIIYHNINGNNFTYTTEEGNTVSTTKGDALKYYEVKYTDKNGEHTINLNYKTNKSNTTNNFEGIVIFEKTPHTVYDGQDLSKKELEDLDAGKVVLFHDDYLVKDGNEYVGFNKEDGKDTADSERVVASDNLVIDDTVTTWSYDAENDTLTRTETQKYTETTYTNAGLDASADSYSDENAAKAQYVSDMQKKIDSLGANQKICIGEGESKVEYKNGDTATDAGFVADERKTYTVSGTFVETYTEDFDKDEGQHVFSNGDIANGHLGGLGQFIGDLLNVNVNHDTARVGVSNNENGGVTVEFGYLTKADRQSFSWLGDLLSGHRNKKDLEAALTAKFAEEGKIFAGIDSLDGNFLEATVYIIDSKQAEDATGKTEAEAYDAFVAAINESITDRGQIHTDSLKTTTATNTKYGYKAVQYIIETAIKDEAVAKTVWNEIAKTSEVQYRNDNWYTGNILLAEIDKERGTDYSTDGKENSQAKNKILTETQANQTQKFRDAVSDAAKVAQKYADLVDKAEKSKKAVEDAKTEVETLKAQIAALKADASVEALAPFSASLADAQKALKDAQDARDALLGKLSEAETELGNKIAELTPAPETAADTETGDDATGGDDETPAAPAQNQAPAQDQAPDQNPDENNTPENTDNTEETENTGDNQETGDVQETANITDPETALASGPADIKEEAAPLAAMPEAQQMSWWWLLLILVLGTTGAEMYRRHMVKKNAAKAENNTDNQ